MFGRHEIGLKSSFCFGRLNRFIHQAHYDGAHEYIAYEVELNKYQRENKCSRDEARAALFIKF